MVAHVLFVAVEVHQGVRRVEVVADLALEGILLGQLPDKNLKDVDMVILYGEVYNTAVLTAKIVFFVVFLAAVAIQIRWMSTVPF